MRLMLIHNILCKDYFLLLDSFQRVFFKSQILEYIIYLYFINGIGNRTGRFFFYILCARKVLRRGILKVIQNHFKGVYLL